MAGDGIGLYDIHRSAGDATVHSQPSRHGVVGGMYATSHMYVSRMYVHVHVCMRMQYVHMHACMYVCMYVCNCFTLTVNDVPPN